MGGISRNMLKNGGFEAGKGSLPDGWTPYGKGSVTWLKRSTAAGSKCLKLKAEPPPSREHTGVRQKAGLARPGALYEATIRIKRAAGTGHGWISFVFRDAAGKVTDLGTQLTGIGTWQRHAVAVVAPADARGIELAISAERGSGLLVADVELKERPRGDERIEFDLKRLNQRIGGFGVNYFTSELKAPVKEFENLNIRWIRVTKDISSWAHMKWLYRKCVKLNIKWIYVLWLVPKKYQDRNGNLGNPAGFARHWVKTVRELDRQGCRPHYIDLVNEPDYFGIPPKPYAELVRQTRRKLDAAGYNDVVIVGPGLTHVGAGNLLRWLEALDQKAVDSIGVWATHGWDDYWRWQNFSGDALITDYRAGNFVRRCRERDAAKPVWYTEYATWQKTHHGVTYPSPENESGDNYCVTYTMPFAMNTYANTLFALNHGVEACFYWSSGDRKNLAKQWGYLDPWGKRKAIWHALRSFWGAVLPGSRAVVPPRDMALKSVYAGAFQLEPDDGFVVGMVNTSAETRRAKILLRNAPPGLKVASAERVEVRKWGDVKKKVRDTAHRVPARVNLKRSGGGYAFEVYLARDSALTVRLSGPR